MKISRRELAGMALAASASAQTSNESDELAKAQKQVTHNSEVLVKHELPMSIEPAFQFKASL